MSSWTEVSISPHEFLAEDSSGKYDQWMPPSHILAIMFSERGIRVKPLTLAIEPPYEIWHNPANHSWVVRQGPPVADT